MYPQGLLTREQAPQQCCHLILEYIPDLAGKDLEMLHNREGSPALIRRLDRRPSEVSSQLNFLQLCLPVEDAPLFIYLFIKSIFWDIWLRASTSQL